MYREVFSCTKMPRVNHKLHLFVDQVHLLHKYPPVWSHEESQMETLKSAIKIRTTTRLSRKVDNSDTDGLKSGRQVAVRCRNATRRRSSSVKMAAPLVTCIEEEHRSVIRFLGSERAKPIEIHRRMKVQYGDACLSLQQVYEWTRKFMNGISSVTDSP